MNKFQLQQELDKLKEKRNKRINRKLSSVLAVLASNNGLSIEQLEKNYKDFVESKRKKVIIEVDKIFKREIARLEAEIKAYKDEPITKTIKLVEVSEPKPKPIEQPVELKPEKKAPERKVKYAKVGKFTQDEISFIEQMAFREQLGYRKIANLLEKDPILVRKQVASMMAEIVA